MHWLGLLWCSLSVQLECQKNGFKGEVISSILKDILFVVKLIVVIKIWRWLMWFNFNLFVFSCQFAMKFQYNLYPLGVRGIELSFTDLHRTDQMLCPNVKILWNVANFFLNVLNSTKLWFSCDIQFMVFGWCSKINHLNQGTQYNENISQMDFGNSF